MKFLKRFYDEKNTFRYVTFRNSKMTTSLLYRKAYFIYFEKVGERPLLINHVDELDRFFVC